MTTDADPSPGGSAGQMRGYLVQPAGTGPFPAILVIHENRGLNPYIAPSASSRRTWPDQPRAASVRISGDSGSTKRRRREMGWVGRWSSTARAMRCPAEPGGSVRIASAT